MADFVAAVDFDIPVGQTEHLYVGRVTAGPNYATGGNLFDLAANTRLAFADIKLPGYLVTFDPATQLAKVYRQKDPGNAGGADIALVEVANAVDLTGVAGTFFAFGA